MQQKKPKPTSKKPQKPAKKPPPSTTWWPNVSRSPSVGDGFPYRSTWRQTGHTACSQTQCTRCSTARAPWSLCGWLSGCRDIRWKHGYFLDVCVQKKIVKKMSKISVYVWKTSTRLTWSIRTSRAIKNGRNRCRIKSQVSQWMAGTETQVYIGTQTPEPLCPRDPTPIQPLLDPS